MKRLKGLLLSGAVLVTAIWAVSPGVTFGAKPPPAPVSINSTSANDETGKPASTVPQQSTTLGGGYAVFSVNDLGMHCGDLDTRLLSILPPFNTLHAQVIQKGGHPQILSGNQTQVYYTAASSPYDIVFDPSNPQPPGFSVVGQCLTTSGNQCTSVPSPFPPFLAVYKTNFWEDPIPAGSYNPFYPANITSGIPTDTGLIVPDPALLPSLVLDQATMPGINGPYLQNAPQGFGRFDTDLQFFVDFPFGYQLANMNWFSADGIPLTTLDDQARVNPYPLMRVQAVSPGPGGRPQVLATIDTVAPISGEANCKNCHTSNDPSNGGVGAPTQPLTTSVVNPIGLSVTGGTAAAAWNDPSYGELPLAVSVEYSQDLNVLRFHDNGQGLDYIDSAGNPAPCQAAPPVPPATRGTATTGTQADTTPGCLTNRALNSKPVVCQTCHYTPALDLAQVGPLGGSLLYDDGNNNGGSKTCPPNAAGDGKGGQPELCVANGRAQRVRHSMSRNIHSTAHGGTPTTTGTTGGTSRFTAFNMPPPNNSNRDVTVTAGSIASGSTVATTGACVYNTNGTLGWPSNTYAQYECTQCAAQGKSVAECAVESTCYQCHPGKYTKCLRGAMADAGIFCQDCHGSMAQVGNDFSGNMSTATPFPDNLAGVDGSKRIPWANEPGCQSCHVGDAVNQPSDTTGFIPAKDDAGQDIPFILAQAWTLSTYSDNTTASLPISVPNSRFAEDQAANGQVILYRYSQGGSVTLPSGDTALRGHQGVACEMCHGSTHAEWPVTPDSANGAWPPASGSFVANDNVTAGQLQGHTGKIIECDTCHSGTFDTITGQTNWLNGPHNLHPVGSKVQGVGNNAASYSQWWVNNHPVYLGQNPTKATLNNKCGICHGTDGNGTVISEVAQTRTVQVLQPGTKKTQTVTLNQGDVVGCGTCHVNPFGPPGPAAVLAGQ